MDFNQYQQYVKQGASEKYKDISFSALALVGEVGEVCDAIKKSNIYDESKSWKDLTAKLKDELGDCLWQWTACVNSLGLNVEEVINYNIEKLNKRHGGVTLDKTGGNR